MDLRRSDFAIGNCELGFFVRCCCIERITYDGLREHQHLHLHFGDLKYSRRREKEREREIAHKNRRIMFNDCLAFYGNGQFIDEVAIICEFLFFVQFPTANNRAHDSQANNFRW